MDIEALVVVVHASMTPRCLVVQIQLLFIEFYEAPFVLLWP